MRYAPWAYSSINYGPSHDELEREKHAKLEPEPVAAPSPPRPPPDGRFAHVILVDDSSEDR